MARLGSCLLIVSLFSYAGWAAEPVSQASGNPQVIVSVYNQAGVPENLLARAEREAGRVLHRASISLTWVNCPTARIGPSECQEATSARRLVVRIVPRALSLSDMAFGAAFLGADGDGKYADVFFDSMQQFLADTTHVSEAQLLGYVMAHEIGHLLLGSHAHSDTGVMRPRWSKDDLQSISMGRLSFTMDQFRKIHERWDTVTSAINPADSPRGDITVTSWLRQHPPLRPRLP